MLRRIRRTVFVSVFGLFLLAADASAQDVLPKTVISIGPIGAILSVYNLELERAVSPNATLALGSTYWGNTFDLASDGSDVSAAYVSLDAKARYYPAQALQGFAFGALIGFSSIGGEETTCDMFTCTSEAERANAVSAGVELDYVWLLGENRKFFVATGVGAKRLYTLGEDDIDATLAYPFGRISVGLAF
jgi:hypothetical protein